MSSSVARAALFLATTALVAAATGSLVSACTTESTTTTGSEDGGDAGKDKDKDSGSTEEEDSGAALSQEECIAACEQTHAAGLAKDNAITQCWEAKCNVPCVTGDGTEPFDAGTGAGSDGGDAGTCSGDISTGYASCDQCTAAFCCGEWDTCFADQDCLALNDCRNACIE